MLNRNTIDLSLQNTGSSQVGEQRNSQKHYLNYVSFQNTQNDIQKRQPDHVSQYSLHTHLKPNSRSNTPNNNAAIINRSPYLNPSIEPRREPPKYNLARNSSQKETLAQRYSQQINKTKTQNVKYGGDGQQSSTIKNSNFKELIKKKSQEIYSDFDSDNYCQTVDLGAFSRNQSIQQSVTYTPDEEIIKQKIQYLEVLQEFFKQFELYKTSDVLKKLNQSNRLFLLKNFEQLNRFKQQRSRKTISDCISESDNMSQDAFSIEERSDHRNNSLRIQSQNKKQMYQFSRSKQKKVGALFADQIKENQKLQTQYQALLKVVQKKEDSEIQKLQGTINSLESQISKIHIKNMDIKNKLCCLPFYQQWMVMCEEAEGAKKTSLKLKEELIKRKQKLRQIKQGGKKQFSQQKQRKYANNQTQVQETSKLPEKILNADEHSLSKNIIPSMKIQSSLSSNRSPIPLNYQPPLNRMIQDSSLRIMGVSHQQRSNSINRSINN